MQHQPPAQAPREVGGYRLLDTLGSGGMGTVYRAWDADQNEVALKLLHPGISADPAARARLRREIATLHRVRGPHVARVLDAEADSAEAFIVTELVNGQSLDDSVREHGPLDEVEVADLADGLADALEAIHAAGVVHRDLKPGNVMLTDDGPVVIDFGISQLADDSRLTQTGLVTGTPGYVDPAVMRGAAPGVTGDWWGWAAILLFGLTGRAPFGKGPLAAVLGRVETGRPDTDGVPAALEPVLRRALDPDPMRRLPPAQVRRALGEYALGQDVTVAVAEPTAYVAPPRSEPATRVAPEPVPRHSVRRPPAAGAAGPAAAGLAAGVPPPPAYPPNAPDPDSGYSGPAPPGSAYSDTAYSGPAHPDTAYSGPAQPWSGPAPAEQWRQAPVTPGSYVPGPSAPEPFTPVPEGPPAWARSPRSRPGVIGAWSLALAALGALLPSVAVAIFVVLLAVFGAVGVGSRALRERRLAAGVRRSDTLRSALASPWYLLHGTVLTLPGLMLAGIAGVTVWGLTAGSFPHEAVAGAGVLVVMMLAWWTPSSTSARLGARSVLARLAPDARIARLWTAAAALVVVALLLAWAAFGVEIDWAPAPSPPVPSF